MDNPLRPPIPPEHAHRVNPNTTTTTTTYPPNTKNSRKRRHNDPQRTIAGNDDPKSDPPLFPPPPNDPHGSSLLPILSRMYVASQTMQLGTEARFTSLVLFHRYVAHFYQSQPPNDDGSNDDAVCKFSDSSMKKEKGRAGRRRRKKHLGTVAAACLFLACKVQEEPRRIRDVINLAYMLGFENDDDGGGDDSDNDGQSSNGSKKRKANPESSPSQRQQQQPAQQTAPSRKKIIIHQTTGPPDLDESYWAAKERIVSTEQSILRLIKFDVSVGQPHRLLVIIYEEIILFHQKGGDGDNRGGDWIRKSSVVLRLAWRRLNDALFYAPALMCGCMELACAALELALEEEGGVGVRDVACRNDDRNSGWKECVGVSEEKMQYAKDRLMEASNLLLRMNEE